MRIQINRNRLKQAIAEEQALFAHKHPKSQQLYQRAKQHLLGGVPMSWMARWAGHTPIFVSHAKGAHFVDVDGNDYVDFCLGDTGAMTGHAPNVTVTAMTAQAEKGITLMLPTENAIWVGEELARRFGLPYWQFALTATDANRHVLRLARHITQRPLVLVFNYCYHGTVDETFVNLIDGETVPRPSSIGAPIHPSHTTRVVEFNDIDGLASALRTHEVACVLAEPAMTNIGIVKPANGFHEALRQLTAETDTLLVMDETHTICCGPGGYTGAYGLQPDILTIGKPLAGGMPAAAYGLSESVARRIQARTDTAGIDISGIGGTLAGNALSISTMRATLEHVLTDEAFDYTIPLATEWTNGVQDIIDEFELPWHVSQLGCRAEYWFCPTPPTNGSQAAAAVDPELDYFMHLAALNRGVLMTPFHNMALMSPSTTQSDIDFHTEIFRQCVLILNDS